MNRYQAAILGMVVLLAGCTVSSPERTVTISDGQWVEVGNLDIELSPDLCSIEFFGDSVHIRKTVVMKRFMCVSSPCSGPCRIIPKICLSGSDSFASCTSTVDVEQVHPCPMVDNCQEIGLDTSVDYAGGVLEYKDDAMVLFDLEVTDSGYAMQPDALGNPQRFSESYRYSRQADTLVLLQQGDGVAIERKMVRK